ncbi:MAG: hypothetical protein HYR94_29520 [Chloroflexi bacterium]|nr:hypothetical protein [Chloroflexota bacterium]
MKRNTLFSRLHTLGLLLVLGVWLISLPGNAQAEEPVSDGLIVYYNFDTDSGSAFTDESGSGNDGTAVGTPTYTPEGKFAGAYNFSSGNYITLNGNPTANLATFSVSLWFKTDDPSQNYKLTSAAWWDNGPGSGWIVGTHTPELWSNDTNSIFTEYYDATVPFVPGEWQHVAITYDGNRFKEYINNQVARDFATTGLPLGDANGRNLEVGAWSQYSFSYEGLIDDFRVYNRALSAEEVALLFNSEPPSEMTLQVQVVGDSEVYPGDTVTVNLNIQGASNLYGLQANCTVDPAILSLQNSVFGDFFANPLIGSNVADAGAGTWLGALSLQNPAEPLSGEGLFATLTYTTLAPGTTAITCEPLASDRDGFELPISAADGSVTVLALGGISGVVTYQGRLNHANIEVTAVGPVTYSALTDSAGQHALNSLKAGDYQVKADAELYLPNCTTATVTGDQTTTLTETVLRGGDTNDNDKIKIGDATLISSNFDLAVPSGDPHADINADGIVNVQDLSMLGGNFGLEGCQAW